jgi:hypothetical protein
MIGGFEGNQMLSDLDIYSAAGVMIRRYGNDAATELAQRADTFASEGDLAGSVAWRRVMRAVEEMQQEMPLEGGAVH